MKVGDVSRRRRFADPVRLRWYALHRARRFARRMARVGAEVVLPCPLFRAVVIGPVPPP
jgi:hypothetical protein